MDEFATRYQRGIAAAVQAIGLIAQRVSPASAALSSTAGMQKQICDLLLPLTMETEPVEQLPPGAVKPAQAAYWVTEGAAFALLMLCDGPGAAAGAHGSASGVAPTMPAHHSDPRYAYGMCLLALRRAERAAQRRGNESDVLLQAIHAVGAAERWRQLYDAASVSSQAHPSPVRSKRLNLNLKRSCLVMVYDRRTCRTRTYKTATKGEESSGSNSRPTLQVRVHSFVAQPRSCSTCHPATSYSVYTAACEAVDQ